MFGRQPRLPLDLVFGLLKESNQKVSHSQYVQQLKSHLRESYEVAVRNMQKLAERNKVRFDKNVKESTLDVGDRVLVRNVRIRGKHKLADKWESEVYVVVKRADKLPVYTVRPETKDAPLRTLHRDLLLPCGFLPISEPVTLAEPKSVSKAKTRSTPEVQEPEELNVNSGFDDESTDTLYRTCPVKGIRFVTYHDLPRQENVFPVSTSESSLPVHSTEEEPSPESTAEHIPVEVSVGNLPDVAESAELICPPETPEVANEDDSAERQCDPVNHTLVEDDTVVSETQCRRSSRERMKPKILTYPSFGNPLIQVVQSLFQGLNTAFVVALSGMEEPNELIEKSQIKIV
ncbi:uncharacterized protein LOC122327417 [Puntigrus tetrazona]|uniref:uncharacterized protein LOC122327417 n=1 Tax=Puntigrus tetrazona TaxID=1606681 RepID=UPI001C8A6797|nr:uncharacterized protein LOC122327417 [Puntigrus tetrazona]